jgi:dihydrodipicolinate synthase/N-acetylneuraminate lyase
MLLEGIFLPLTTPFYPDGRLYLRKLEHNVDRYSKTPAAGMLICTRTGEADSLTDSERQEVLETSIGAAAKDKVMIAGVGRESDFASLLLADAAASYGYDALAVKGPAFSAHLSMRAELMTYFQALADRSPLPLVLMSNIERPLALEVIGELAWHPNIIGAIGDRATPERMARLQEQTNGVSHEVAVTTTFGPVTSRMLKATQPQTGNFVSAESLGSGETSLAGAVPLPALKTRSKRVGFQVLGGSTGSMLTAWRSGATGAAPRLGACAPQACCEVWQAFKDGDLQLAEEKQLRIMAIGEKVENYAGVAAVKHACDLNGYFGGRPRLPLIPLSGEQQAKLELEMAGLRN